MYVWTWLCGSGAVRGARRGAARGATNKGFARRPQRFLGWQGSGELGVGVRVGVVGVGVGVVYMYVWTWLCINKAGRALVTRGA